MKRSEIDEIKDKILNPANGILGKLNDADAVKRNTLKIVEYLYSLEPNEEE